MLNAISATINERRLLIRTLLLIMIIYVLIPVVSGEDVLISYQIEYLMENPIDGKEIITYTFKNINESSSFTLDYVFSTTIRATNIKVTDAPAGFVTYDIKQTGATSVITLSFKRTLTPFEDYTITITGDVSGISEMLGGNFYRFRDIEFANLGNPEQGTRLNDMGVKIYFPNSIWYTYRVTSISSDAVIIYGIAGVKQIIWRFEHPQSQIATFVEFEEMLNPVTFNVIGFVILLTAFMILYYTSRTSEIKLKQMGITKVFPGASDTVARLREMLKDAKEEILITFPLIYYTDWLTAELKPALDRGVRVRVLTWPCYERRQFESVEEVYEDRKQKFTLKRFLEMFPPGVVKINDNIHSKMVVVDRKRILITSANLTQTGLWENYEVGIWAENESLAEEGASYFEMVWNSFESVELTEEMLDAKNSWLAIMKRKEERGRDEI